MTVRLGFLLGLIAAWGLSLPAQAAERILEYRSEIRVHESGTLTITEHIRVEAEGRNIRRGIYRDFPTRYRDRANNRVEVEFVPLSVRRNGQPESWHVQDRANGVRIYAGHPDREIGPGNHEFEFVFSTNRQLGFFADHDELYFNAVGHGWAFPVERAVADVVLPFSLPDKPISTSVYTGRQGSKAADATVTFVGDDRVRFTTTRALGPNEGLTVAVGWPKGLIAAPDTGQKVRWFLEDNGAALALLLGLLAPLAWYLWSWNAVGRDPGKGVIIPRFEPPGGLSPAACRYVKSMSFNRHAFTAAIISLAVKGWLTIEEDDGEFTLVRNPDGSTATPTPGEQAVLDTLLPDGSSRIAMDNENHRDFQAARNALSKALKKEHHGRLFVLNGIYLLPPLLMSVTAAFIAFFLEGGPAVWISFLILTLALHGLFAFLLRAPTVAGRLVMDQIEGFEMYLGTAEQERLDRMRSPALTPEVFESFLPFAFALGVENTWCERFAREIPQEAPGGGYNPVWYHGNLHGTRALSHLGDGFSGSFSSAIASASAAPGSSSGSGGGGFSGGGGGGGGGGGW